MTKAPKPTEMSKGQSDNTNNATKRSITQRLRTDLWRSVVVTTATQLVWLTWLNWSIVELIIYMFLCEASDKSWYMELWSQYVHVPTLYFRLRLSTIAYQQITVHYSARIMNCKLWIMNCKQITIYYSVRIMNSELWTLIQLPSTVRGLTWRL